MKTLKQKDYLWNTLGVLLQNAISPILLVVVTRVNGIDDSGVFSFAFSIAIIFWAIAMWGGRTYQVSDVAGKFLRKSYIVARFLLSTAVLVIAYLFCVVNGYDMVKTAVLMSLVVIKITEAIADAYYGVMQSSKKLYRSGQIMVAKYASASIAFAITDIVTSNLLMSCIAFLIVMTAFLIFIDIPYTRRLDHDIKGRIFTKEVVHGAMKVTATLTPVFIVTLFAMLPLNIPRFFTDVHHQADIGYFGILAMPVTLIVLVMTFILQPNVIELSRLFQEKKLRQFNGYVVKISAITGAIGLVILGGTAVIGVPALELVFGVDFSDYYYPLLVIVLAAAVNALVGIMTNILVIMRVFVPQLIVLVVTNIILAIISAVVIPQGGILSAMVLFLCVNTVQVLILSIVYSRAVTQR